DGLSKCSITGGYVYRGLNYPSLQGRYIFADFCSNEIGYINTAGDIVYTDPFSGNLSSFGEDQNKELYVAALNTGIIYSIIDPSLSLAETTVVAATLYPNPARSVLHIEHNHTSNTATRHFELYDISGRLVLSEKYTDQKHSVSVTELTAGVYFAKTAPKSQAIKVIIQ
ncbi:MAG: cadherin, partial [Cytophagaceae bacterium]|nr:cadherin [Cytophagaceae bacterium]